MANATPAVAVGAARQPGAPFLPLGRVLRQPLPHLQDSPLTRWLTRAALVMFRARILEVRGVEHIRTSGDPFILVLNHSQRAEAVLVPGLLFFLRDGKRIHFMADWNFCLIPFVAVLYRCAQTITLTRKPARPRFLDVFRPLFVDAVPAFERAQQCLASGAPVGIFPEGTVNRDSGRLLKGYSGAARLSLETNTPVVPAGIRFPTVPAGEPVPGTAPFEIEFGAPMTPPATSGTPGVAEVREWHERMMSEIGRLSGKTWQFHSKRR